jgi:hypothetical protein
MPHSDDPDHHTASRSRHALRAVRSQVQPGSFPVLLAASLLVYLLNGFALESAAGVVIVALLRGAVICAGIYVLSASRTTLWLGLLMLGLVIVVAAHPGNFDPRVTEAVQDGLTSAFILWVLVVVLREVFRASTTEFNAVIGALCGFVLLVSVFTRVHGLLEALTPGSYHVDGPALAERSDAEQVATFQYFSTITLTTVGFGDIVPVTRAARLATGLEAMSGQIYLAVVVAALVGRVAARNQ